MLWDTGMSDAIAGKPDGVTAAGGLLTLWVEAHAGRRNCVKSESLLRTIPHIAISHFHGTTPAMPTCLRAAKLYIQGAEYEAAFGPEPPSSVSPRHYEKLRANPW